jgi:UTP:GlnB (protein PII) uridylyltransferase
LFWLSNTLQHAGLSISFAKINTEGERVADVFYVADEAGNQLVDAARIEELKGRIMHTISRLDSGG